MSQRRFVTLLIAAVLAITAALVVSSRRSPQPEVRGAALLPALAGEMDTVTSLSIRKGGPSPSVTVHEQDGHWTVAERAGYPADVTKLRRLLLALSDAKLVEEKTSNPASFPVIGVEDPSSPGAGGAEISFVAKDGKHAVIVGKPAGEGNYARRVGENTSYTIEPAISFEAEPRYWIDPHLLDIAADRIQSVAIQPPAGAGYTVHRAVGTPAAGSPAAGSPAAGSPAAGSPAAGAPAATQPGAASAGSAPGTAATPASAPAAPATAPAAPFVLDGVPAGRKAADSASLAPSPSGFSRLTADDVAPANSLDFSKATVATITLSDGNVITLTGTAIADKHWIQVQSAKDAALEAKAAGRAFEIAGYRFDAIFRPLEQLLVPKEPPPGAAKPGAAKPGTAAQGFKPAASAVPSPKKKPAPAPAP